MLGWTIREFFQILLHCDMKHFHGVLQPKKAKRYVISVPAITYIHVAQSRAGLSFIHRARVPRIDLLPS
jgi:hypothetical protein